MGMHFLPGRFRDLTTHGHRGRDVAQHYSTTVRDLDPRLLPGQADLSGLSVGSVSVDHARARETFFIPLLTRRHTGRGGAPRSATKDCFLNEEKKLFIARGRRTSENKSNERGGERVHRENEKVRERERK